MQARFPLSLSLSLRPPPTKREKPLFTSRVNAEPDKGASLSVGSFPATLTITFRLENLFLRKDVGLSEGYKRG